MYPKKIKFTDFNGNEREQTFLFNLTKAELLEMQTSIGGGFTEYVKRIIDAQDTVTLTKLFKKLILMSYGEKSDDGMRFIKKDAVRGDLGEEFAQTAAYAELYTELATDEKAAIEFINGVIPADVRDEANKQEGHAFPPSVQ